MKDKTFLTVDTGGSKTNLCLYNESGLLIKSATTVGFGLAIDSQEPILELASALKEFCADCIVLAAICNLGGKNKTQLENTLKAVFSNTAIKLFRESEGIVGEKLCKKFGAEVALMAGTGTISIMPIHDKIIISGGWGANIGDNGSGYQLGLEAIRLSLAELDGAEELSLLTKTITGIKEQPREMTAKEYCDFRDGVRKTLAPLDRAHIASFAKTVFSCAKQGDEKALALYEKVGCDLAYNVILPAQKANKELTSVIVTGGMVNAKEFWQLAFEQSLKEKYKNINFYYLTNGIDIVMCDMAKEIIKGE